MLSLKKTLALPILFSVLLAGCHSKTGGSSAPIGTVGVTPSAGGTLTVTTGALAGLVLVIPPNAVTGDLDVTLHQGNPTAIAGRRAVGPVATLGPNGTNFMVTAMLTLPFTPEPGVVIEILEEILIAVRDDTTGAVVEVTADSIDEVAGLADLDIDHFSSYWVTAALPPPPPAGTVVLADYFPLNIGDIYQYEEETTGEIMTMRVVTMSTNPNIPGAQFRLQFISPDETDGEYFSLAPNGDLITHGFFSETDNEEEAFVSPVVFAPGVITLGSNTTEETDTTEHSPIGSPGVLFRGHISFETFFELQLPGEEGVTTPAGTFEDVFVVGRRDTDFFGDSEETLIGLAKGVGIFGFVFFEGEDELSFLLRGAVVGGVAIGEPINTDF